MRVTKWMWLAILMSLFLLFFTVGCGAPADPPVEPDEEVDEEEEEEPDEEPVAEPTRDQIVYIGVSSEPHRLDPRFGAGTVAARNVQTLVHDSLISWDDETLEIEYVLAEEVNVIDPQTYEVKLREGVLFHNGEELTTADVEYTYNTLRDPDAAASNFSHYAPIVEIEVHDDYSLTFHLEAPNMPFLYRLRADIVSKSYSEEHATDDNPYGDDYTNMNPLGTGPFKFVEWRTGEEIILEANDDYWQGRPKLDRVIFRPIPDATTRTVELQTGEIHINEEIDPVQVAITEADENVVVSRRSQMGFQSMGIHVNLGEPTDDVRVRQAIAHMMPREDIIDYVMHGLGEPAYGPIPPGHWAHEPNVPRFEYDPARAQELLADAGYPDGFEAELYVIEDSVRVQLCEIIQEELATIGIDVNINVLEGGAFWDQMRTGESQMFQTGWNAVTDPDDFMWRQFHSNSVPPHGANRQFYQNPEFDAIIEEALQTTEQSKRKELYSEAQKMVVEDASYVFIYHHQRALGQSPDLRDFEYSIYFNFRSLMDAYLAD